MGSPFLWGLDGHGAKEEAVTTRIEGRGQGDIGARDAGSTRGSEGGDRAFEEVMASRQAKSEGRCGDEHSRKLLEGHLQRGDGEGYQANAMADKGGREGVTEGGLVAAQGDKSSRPSDGEALVADRDVAAQGEMAERELRSEALGPRDVAGASTGQAASTVEEIARRVVEAIHVGKDQRMRQVLFMDLKVPGRGEVRIRLRQEGGGYSLRMRADNDGLARDLQMGAQALRQAGAAKGLRLETIEVHRSGVSQGG